MSTPVGLMGKPDATLKKRFSRRDFLKVATILGLDAFILGIAGVGYMQKVEPAWVEVNDVRLKLPRLPGVFSGLRVAQLSDIHIGYWMTVDRVREIFEIVLAQSPDLLVLTGDFVLAYGRMTRSYIHELDQMALALRRVSDHLPVLAVLGNHDHLYSPDQVRAALERGGAHVLMNSAFTLTRGAARFHVGGMDDFYRGRPDLSAVLNAFPSGECAILLVHEPDFADTSALTGRFDLQISGHSHGGQVVLPFIGPPILPKWGEKYFSGLYQVGEMFQYTNRGIGMTFPAVRFNCRPEITVFTLESLQGVPASSNI